MLAFLENFGKIRFKYKIDKNKKLTLRYLRDLH